MQPQENPCRVLLGLHGDCIEGFFLKNLYCLQCSSRQDGRFYARTMFFVIYKHNYFTNVDYPGSNECWSRGSPKMTTSQQVRDVKQCCASVVGGGPILSKHWFSVMLGRLLGSMVGHDLKKN